MARSFGRFVAGLFLSALSLFCVGALYAEDGCPTGTLPSYEGDCKPLSPYSDLPLNDQEPMKFGTIQVSMVIIFHQAIGLITEDTPAAFTEFLKSGDAGYSKDLHIHSYGGNLLAALKLGELIRAAGFNTSLGRAVSLDGVMDVYSYPEADCYSACAYAFLGGVTRSFSEHDKFGVHRFGMMDGTVSGDDAQILSAILSRYIEHMGVDQALLEVATSASFKDDIALVSVESAQDLRVIYDPSGRTSFRVEERGGRPVALFDFQKRETPVSGLLLCSQGAPYLVLFDQSDSTPDQLKSMHNFPARFMANGRVLEGFATYHRRKDNTSAYVEFRIPGLRGDSFAGNGLTLDEIYNPTLAVPPETRAGEEISTELVEHMRWLDGVMAYSFGIVADNGARTLPLVLRDCS